MTLVMPFPHRIAEKRTGFNLPDTPVAVQPVARNVNLHLRADAKDPTVVHRAEHSSCARAPSYFPKCAWSLVSLRDGRHPDRVCGEAEDAPGQSGQTRSGNHYITRPDEPYHDTCSKITNFPANKNSPQALANIALRDGQNRATIQ
jgi:hypothetical protein